MASNTRGANRYDRVSPSADYTIANAWVPVVRTVRLPLWLCAVQAVLAYEWIISGLNKLLYAHFDAKLPGQLHDSIKGNPYGWYGAFLQQVVLPHHQLFAVLVRWGELAAGIALLLGALLWAVLPKVRLTLVMAWLCCLALIGSAIMAANYFFQGGTPLPWIDPGNAFNPGVDVGILVPLISLALLAANVHALRARSLTHPVPSHARVMEHGERVRI